MRCGKRGGLVKSSRQKTVAILLNTSWNIYNFRVGLLKALQKDGYRVVCIAPYDEYSIKLQKMGFEYHNININNKGINPIEDLKLIWSLYKIYRLISPDIVLQYTIKPNIYGSIAAGFLKLNVISNISGLGTVFLNNNFSSKIARLLYKIALKVPKKVFFQNSSDRELFLELNLVEQSKSSLLAGSGIDVEKFKPVAYKKKDSNNFKFLFIARLLKDKGLVEYVEASRLVGNAKSSSTVLGAFYLGNPTAVKEDEMKRWEEEGVIHYLGVSDNVKSIIEQYDCIVLPSYREGLSRVLLEAASMQKPIITTNVAGCREVVDDGVNGYLCKVKDVNSLSKQMKKMLLLSDDELEKMGIKGREKVKKEFDEKLVIDKYRETIDYILL